MNEGLLKEMMRALSETGIEYMDDLFKLEFKELSKENLGALYRINKLDDSDLAEFFNIDVMDVMIVRHKHNIPLRYDLDPFYEKKLRGEAFQLDFKSKVLDFDSEKLAKGITHYVFRNGSIEDIHAGNRHESKISQGEMELLNKHMCNRLHLLLEAFKNDDWADIHTILEYCIKWFGSSWDEPFSVKAELNKIYQQNIETAQDMNKK